jgi:hypothetical protein
LAESVVKLQEELSIPSDKQAADALLGLDLGCASGPRGKGELLKDAGAERAEGWI